MPICQVVCVHIALHMMSSCQYTKMYVCPVKALMKHYWALLCLSWSWHCSREYSISIARFVSCKCTAKMQWFFVTSSFTSAYKTVNHANQTDFPWRLLWIGCRQFDQPDPKCCFLEPTLFNSEPSYHVSCRIYFPAVLVCRLIVDWYLHKGKILLAFHNHSCFICGIPDASFNSEWQTLSIVRPNPKASWFKAVPSDIQPCNICHDGSHCSLLIY